MKKKIIITVLAVAALASTTIFGMEKPQNYYSANVTISNHSKQIAVIAMPTEDETNPIKLKIIQPLEEYTYGYVDSETKALFYIATLTNKYKIIYSDKNLSKTLLFGLKGEKPHYFNLMKLRDHGLPQTEAFEQTESFNTMILIKEDGTLKVEAMCD